MCDLVVDEVFHLVDGGVAEDEDGHGDAVAAQLYCLIKAADGEVVCTELLEALADLDRSMTVGVCLDDTEELDAVADALAQGLVVVVEGVEVDFCPGSPQG